MGQVTIFLHRSLHDYIDHLAENVLGLSRSETIETMLRYVLDEDLEDKVWENYDDLLEEFEDKVKDYETAMTPIWKKEEESESEESKEEEEGLLED
jgi:CO dehydrogenase/acetyl-CoA synthase beta subunit